MPVSPGLFVARDAGGNGTTPKGARQALAGLLAKNSDGTVRTGVLIDGLGPVVTGAAGMSYNVRKLVAVTKASEINGPVLVPNDGTVSVSTDPAPGANSRIDVIYVLQRLVTGDGGSESTNAPVIGVAVGAASSVPSKPGIPTGATELGSFVVTAGATATSGLTFTPGQWTAANGVDTSLLAGYAGGAWPPVKRRSGSATVNTNATGFVTIPHGGPGIPSCVLLSGRNGAVYPYLTDRDETSITMRFVSRVNGAAVSAVQSVSFDWSCDF